MGVPFLGEIPLDIKIREGSDNGRPVVADQPEGTHAMSYRTIAEAIWSNIQNGVATPKAPTIVME